ncbi:MAG: hypothetical protein IPM64_10685 [Phycisphaerales bacterium]|nr:hypothetical protein [Phycisphaerales bacterium]
MKTFNDNAGRTWTIAIHVDAIKRVRGLLNVDLLEIVEGRLVERLYRDPILLCDVVYAVCKPEADALGVSDEEFGRAMAGDAIERATTALLEELVGFSPSPRDRANLQRVLTTTQAVLEKARDAVEARLTQLNPDELVAHALATSGASSGTPPGSSASNPGG